MRLNQQFIPQGQQKVTGNSCSREATQRARKGAGLLSSLQLRASPPSPCLLSRPWRLTDLIECSVKQHVWDARRLTWFKGSKKDCGQSVGVGQPPAPAERNQVGGGIFNQVRWQGYWLLLCEGGHKSHEVSDYHCATCNNNIVLVQYIQGSLAEIGV